jgi:hypothetical protein
VALAHIKSIKSSKALSKRHLIIAKDEPDTMQQYAMWIKEELEPKGYSICTRVAPNFLLKLYRYFKNEKHEDNFNISFYQKIVILISQSVF